MFSAVRLRLKMLILWTAPFAGLACGGEGGTDVVLPSLRISTATSGVETDPDGYGVSIDGQASRPIGVNATLTVDEMSDGQYTVELSGIAGNCAVSGENPISVSVAAGSTANVAFVITCSANAGSIEVSTTTSGDGTDPDGFTLLLDGADRGTIAVSAISSIAGLAPGSHSIGLTGLAANCQVSGENPRTVTVLAGGTAQVAFAVTCTTTGPTTGTLEIVTATTGPAQDADGYLVSVDGGANQPIGTNATLSLASVSAAQHTVELLGLASNCSVAGDNPLGVAVGPGETARVSFAVTCAATVGSLTVTIEGLPGGTAAAVTVTGPNDFSQTVTETRTLNALAPGSYGVSAQEVTTGGTTYTPSVSRPNVDVAAGATATVSVSYTGAAPVTLNLRIDGLNLTQSTQTYASDVPLVAGRDGYLRVFVVANEANSARPSVRVRLSRPGATPRTFTVTGPSSVPREVNEGSLGSSWNVEIPGSLIRPDLSIVAELDPGDDIAESNESDNRFPASGTKALTVRTAPVARIRFVSVRQGLGEAGDVSNANQLVELARRMHPLSTIDVDVDPDVFPASAPLTADGGGWFQLLSDLDGKRVAEGTDRIYFGIVRLGYGRDAGWVGLTLGQGVPTAAGWDDPADASRVVAHELGHVWGRRHSPCGGPPDVDVLYPYAGGQIGVYGMDVARSALKARTSPDIMTYCFTNPWISDYTYERVMDFRAAGSAVAGVRALPQPSILIWGRLVNGRPVLEPAFQMVTRPNLPRKSGPYTVTAAGVDGARLFSLSFDMASAQDQQPGNGHFAFAVPLDQVSASRLGSLRLQGPTGSATSSPRLAQLRTGPDNEPVVAQRQGENVLLRWNPAVYPMIMVRDPDTGHVLTFGRGGTALVRTTKGELDLDVSDGVRSQRVRLAISRS